MSTTKMADLFGKNLTARKYTKEEVLEYCCDTSGEFSGFFALEDEKYYICSEDSHADYILEAVQAFDSNQEKVEEMKMTIECLADWLELVVGLRDKGMGYASEWVCEHADDINEMLLLIKDND